MNTDAVAKIAMIKGSVRCLAFGLFGLSPFIGLPFTVLGLSTEVPLFGLLGILSLVGLPFALVALWIAGRVRMRERQYWNAAKPFRIWGTVCAAAGAATWMVIATLIAYNAITAGWPYND